MNRRSLLLASAVVAVDAIASPEADPLYALLTEYERETAYFNNHPRALESDELDAVLAAGWRRIYEMENLPAPTSRAGAAKALLVVLKENEDNLSSDFAERLVRAVVDALESRRALS